MSTTDTGPRWARRQLRAFLTGVMFLTRLPCPAWVGHDADYLARSTVYFPVIGFLVGAVGAAAFWVANLFWSPLVALVAALTATVWLTGAFHEDGLADAFDGFGGGWTKDEMLAIMKDSRLGTYGAVALVLTLAGKLGALAALTPGDVVRALLAGHLLGRWSTLPLVWRYAYVREKSATGSLFAASVTPGRLALGTAFAGVVAAGVLGWQAVPVLATAAAVTGVAGWFFRRQIGGITGDCLGAANQLVELSVYLALAFRWPAAL